MEFTESLKENTIDENNSGKGRFYPVPDGVKGWSCGAFLLSAIWAIWNKTWYGLLAGIPFLGLIVAIKLGLNGRESAWQNVHWDSLEHFNKIQKRWSICGICLFVVPCVAIIAIEVPSKYEDQNQKEKVLTSEKIVDDIARAIGDYVLKNHTLPSSVEEAGFNGVISQEIQSVSIDSKTGILKILMNAKPVKGRAFYMAPSYETKEKIVWRCLKGEMLESYLPKKCRFDTADEFHVH